MKYLQDEQLARWTSALTEVPIGQSRILHGRLEAYSMKRASSDKKYAAVLGEKYVEQLHQDQEWAANMPRFTRKRSQSAGLIEESLGTTTTTVPPPTKRRRSCSLDAALSQSSMSPLGDFSEQATRRLMTDLVLTLNASFPDYDFSAIKPTDLTKMPTKRAIKRINESLSEWAASGGGRQHNLIEMWEAVDQSIRLKDCDVFLFTPSEDASFLLAAAEAMISSEDDDDDDDYVRLDSAHNYHNIHSHDEERSSLQSVLWSFFYLFVNKHLKRILLFSCAEAMRHVVSNSDADHENQVERFVPFSDAGASDDVDFDLDPESITAGGIPFSTLA